MPTGTSLLGWSLFNIGPLTTTFTAPASCSTEYRTMIAPASNPALFQWNVHCPWLPPADCNPSGSVVRSLVSSAAGDNPSAGMFIPYNSPGLACPSGWETVGAAAKPNPTSISTSGVFNQTGAIPTDSGFAPFVPQLDAFLEVMDPGETAILCCPSSYTASNAGCHSTLPSSVFSPTSGCGFVLPQEDLGTVSGTWTIGEQTVIGELLTLTATIPPSPVTTSFAPSEAPSYVGVAVEGLYFLVHQSSDIVTTSDTTTASQPTSASTSSSTSKPNSAAHMRGSEKGLGVFTAVCGLFVMLGVFLPL